MHQEFNGTANGQFSARDIINIHHQNEPVSEDEQLLPAQRQRLHQLLDEISAISVVRLKKTSGELFTLILMCVAFTSSQPKNSIKPRYI
ncbi:hypothetical protein [Dickeya ananatis]|uniref:hypothetical protein n=1 Tax=Dickeya ananatis TaxID=3061286 RepID=UPI00388F0DA3